MARYVRIGTLARATGIPVKTIRHYSDTGVLPPAARSDGRYRLYRDTDRAHLEVIRLLRSLDFDLPTIRALLTRRRPVREGLRAHRAVVEAKLRALTRTRAVLARAEAAPTDDAALAALERLHAVAALDAADRSAALRATMEHHLRGVPADRAWRARLWDVAFKDLPADLDDSQWAALVELIDLVQDEEFGRRLADQGRSYWSAVQPGDPRAPARLRCLARLGARASDKAVALASPRAARLVGQFVRWSARNIGRAPSPQFARWLRVQGEKHDVRAERFWTLVGLVRGWTGPPQPEIRGYKWLFAALAVSQRSGRA